MTATPLTPGQAACDEYTRQQDGTGFYYWERIAAAAITAHEAERESPTTDAAESEFVRREVDEMQSEWTHARVDRVVRLRQAARAEGYRAGQVAGNEAVLSLADHQMSVATEATRQLELMRAGYLRCKHQLADTQADSDVRDKLYAEQTSHTQTRAMLRVLLRYYEQAYRAGCSAVSDRVFDALVQRFAVLEPEDRT